MAILFDFYQSPPQEEEGKEDKIRVYPRVVYSKTVGAEELAAIIHERCSLTEGDVYNALINLGKVISERLCDGQRVYLKGIGYFSLILTSTELRTTKDLRANNVGVKTVKFRPDKYLKSDLRKTHVQRSTMIGHSAQLSNEEVDQRVAKYLKENPVIVRRNIQSICQIKEGMARKHINRMLEEGKIKNIGSKQQPIYVVGS